MSQNAADVASATRSEFKTGINNLLFDCIGVNRGERLLIVGEHKDLDYYDNEVYSIVASHARGHGITTTVVLSGTASGPDDMPLNVLDAMQSTDHTVFFSRLGDQIRFSRLHGASSKTMCYALEPHYLASEFSRVPYKLFSKVHDLLMATLLESKHYAITCPLGTNLTADVHYDDHPSATAPTKTFTVKPFPLLIFPPLDCINMAGEMVLSQFLMTTSINNYENSVLKLDRPVTAKLDNSRILSFHGDSESASLVDRHYQTVGARFTGDCYAVNSWHAGIYPKTYYVDNALDHVQRWSDLVFGSPRYTHFHTCGDNPGNVACSVFDATITFDDQPIWQQGRFVFLDRPECQKLLAQYPDAEDAYEMRWDIGL